MEKDTDIQMEDLKTKGVKPEASTGDKILAALCYVPIIALLSLFVFNDKELVYAHAKQSIVFWVIFAIVMPAGFFLFFILLPLFATWLLVAVLYALSGRMRVPVLAEIADILPIK